MKLANNFDFYRQMLVYFKYFLYLCALIEMNYDYNR